MEGKVNYTVVGLFVVILTAAAVMVALWLSSDAPTKHYHKYIVYMNESVSGLNVQSSVRYNGVVVGNVNSITLDRKNPQRVTLVLDIEQDIPITTSTRATMVSQGLTGIAFIGLQAKTADAPRLQRQTNAPYPVIETEPSIFTRLDNVIRELSTNLSDITQSINLLLSDQNRQALSQSIENFQAFTATLAKNSHVVETSIQHANQMLLNTAKASQHLPQAMVHLEKTLNDMQSMAKGLQQASHEAKRTLQDSRTVIQGVSQQALPSTMHALHQLSAAAQSVQQLTQQLQQNPSMLVRGKAAAKPGPGEF